MGQVVPGEELLVVGWGSLYENGGNSNTLQWLRVPVIATSDCNKCNVYNGKITSNMLCAGYLNGVGKDACKNDRGGPLTRGYGKSAILVGIASWGDGENNDI